jgi:SAM-dependent methyltransferase
LSEQEIRVQVWRGKGKAAPQPGSAWAKEVDSYQASSPAKVEEMPVGDLRHIPPPPDKKYVGAVAAQYDDKREEQPRWHEEQAIIEQVLDEFSPGTKILDVPFGTGRFLKKYVDMRFEVIGVDVSKDMLAQAAEKLVDGEITCSLYQGDIRDLSDIRDKAIDVTVMTRMTRWLSPTELASVMKELGRITRKEIILTARIANHLYARPLSMFAMPGWEIASTAVPSDKNYHVVRMRAVYPPPLAEYDPLGR